MIGNRFGRWTVLSEAEKTSHGHSRWLCRCDCGVVKVVQQGNLKSGKSTSCGCFHREDLSRRAFKHGFNTSNPIYSSWVGMRDRCHRKSAPVYKHYGGRGIKVCSRWSSFASFYEDMSPSWFPGATLERINNDKDYSPGNVRWATRAEQAANRGCNWSIQVGQETITAVEFSRRFKVAYHRVLYRLRRGIPLDDITRNWQG